MKRLFKLWQIGGFVFTGIAGVMLHFLYDWTNQCIFVAPFSAVNESIWEHMKLLFFPMFVFSLVEYKFFGKDYENFWCAKLFGITAGLLLIPIIYYTYTGALGVNADWFNIVIFFTVAGIVCYLEILLLKNKTDFLKSPLIAFVLLCLLAVMFIAMTFVQPKIPMFQDMSTGKYGI